MATFGDTCNYCLDLTGELRIAEADFDIDESLSRPQLQIKQFVRTSDRLLGLRFDEMPFCRRYTFNTVAAQTDYDLNNTTNLEAIQYHSMYCNGLAAGSDDDEFELINRTYHEYKNQRLGQLVSGKPQFWTSLNSESDAAARTNKIRISPAPDDVYEIEYIAKKSAPALSAFSDVLLWDDIYIDHLYLAAADLLNDTSGTGPSLADRAMGAINAVRVWCSGSLDEQRGVHFGGLQINGNLRDSSVSDRDSRLHRW